MKFAKLAALSSIFAASASGAVTSARGNSVRSLVIYQQFLIDSAQLGHLTDRFHFVRQFEEQAHEASLTEVRETSRFDH